MDLETPEIITPRVKAYYTAFFEAFPRNPNTFIRGEGSTIKEAEEKAWKNFQEVKKCPKHEFERRGYKNGGGFCKHCNLWNSKAFEPSVYCKICGVPTYYHNEGDDWYCKKCGKDKVISWYVKMGMSEEEARRFFEVEKESEC